jgi:hypothetical protein
LSDSRDDGHCSRGGNWGNSLSTLAGVARVAMSTRVVAGTGRGSVAPRTPECLFMA